MVQQPQRIGFGRTPPDKITIRDVARAADVSVSTVSHVLSGKRPTSVLTRKRVKEVVDELGYRPNAVAQSLVWRRPLAIGLIIPDITNPYYPSFARGAEDRIRAQGFNLVLGNSDYDAPREETYLDLVRAKQLAGVIYCLSGYLSPIREQLMRGVREGLPVVLVHRPSDGIPTVCADNLQGGACAAEHLLELGHAHIGVVSARPVDEGMNDREEGFRRGLIERGAAADRALVPVEYGDHQIQGGREAARRLLKMYPRLTALFALNDLMALGALEAAREAGRRVPEDLSVMGFDDIAFAALANPPLTTIGQPIRELGARAADLLLALLGETSFPEGEDEEVPSILLPSELIARSSTAAMKVRA